MPPSRHKNQSYIRFVSAAIITIAIAIGFSLRNYIGLTGGAEEIPISWFILVAAIVGSVVNQPFSEENLENGNIGLIVGYILWKVAVSIVFAFALYMIFIAGFISGDLFPRFVKTTIQDGGQYVNMKEFVTKVDPESYKDVAKILVWSFIAGFSEKFVPNLIFQIIRTTENRGDK